VYKVKLGNQYFAMKMIQLEEKHLKLIKDQSNISEIEKNISEIHIWKELDHPNIIRYYTSFIEKKCAYIIIELVEGINLSEYIANLKEKNSKPKESDIIKILVDIVCALKYLHKEKGVLYRDINPHNIMLDNNFNVKLGDFGLARLDGASFNQSMNAFEGSILYSSPEVVKNQGYTEKSDIWSLGCIIYELLTLRPPFEGDNPLTVTKNIVELNYKKLNPDEIVNKKLLTSVEKCLTISADDRFDVMDLCDIMGSYFVDKINSLKKNEFELRNENETLREKIYKLELAFTTNNNFSDEYLSKVRNIDVKNNFTESRFKASESLFKQSVFKRISDPLNKIIDMINKILFLSEVHNNMKDDKYIFINKFKRKLFGNRDNWNPDLVKTEVMKVFILII
jgi:serine/threonine protein kinase